MTYKTRSKARLSRKPNSCLTIETAECIALDVITSCLNENMLAACINSHLSHLTFNDGRLCECDSSKRDVRRSELKLRKLLPIVKLCQINADFRELTRKLLLHLLPVPLNLM
jgi:hypothetical protein